MGQQQVNNKHLKYSFEMSCCFSSQRRRIYIAMHNRLTDQPVRFDENEIQELRVKFENIAGVKKIIDLESFKRNIGILGMQSAQEFSARLFNSFDIDNDNKISFSDFVEYMEVLKCGSDDHKARISFQLIDLGKTNRITVSAFKQFLNDFYKSWSSITNITITSDIKERTDEYVKAIFKKVKAVRGIEEIDFKHYANSLYKDKDFTEAFEFITQGVANIFISDKQNTAEEENTRLLVKILKELNNIKEVAFDMNTGESLQFEDFNQDTAQKLPPFTKRVVSKTKAFDAASSIFNKKIQASGSTAYASNNTQKPKNNVAESESDLYSIAEHFTVNNNTSRNDSSDAKRAQLLQRKLDFVKERIDRIIQDSSPVLANLNQKFAAINQKISKAGAKNVHKKMPACEGRPVFIGDSQWNLVLNMMLGIQMAVRSVKGYQEMIYEEARDFGLKYYFELIPRRFGGEQDRSIIYSFTDYAPNTFNHIRKVFKIDNEDYINSIGPSKLMRSLMMGEMNAMTSLTSQGKSGSFFYYTADGRFMLKTIQYREYKFLRSILETYYYYLKKNPSTLITKFFGLHKLMSKDSNGKVDQTYYFVIMANVFNTRDQIVERYDLKGSTYGRETNDTDPKAVRKDNDFLNRKSFFISAEERENLVTIIQHDAQFFRQNNIIDYSLLVGVIRPEANQLGQTRAFDRTLSNSFLNTQAEQGLETRILGSTRSPQRYIIGIIDILTLYDARKTLEYHFKSLLFGKGISAVPPEQYAERFMQFIENKVFRSHDELNCNTIR